VNRTPIRIVCFDVGGVIIRHCRSWREGCAAAGLPVRDGCEGESAARRRKELACAFTCGLLSPGEFYGRMSEAIGGLYSPAEVEQVHRSWLGGEYAGVGGVVRRLVDAARVDTGVLSNTNQPHWARFEAQNGRPPEFPTAALLRHQHASHRLGLMKPDPAIYEAFERHTGYRGGEVLFLEDMPENAAAAAARGWRVVLIDHTRETAGPIESALRSEGLI
jgi:FMN phosphatase YigB (HAD superfamily)